MINRSVLIKMGWNLELKAKDFLTLNMIPIKTVPGTAASIVPMDVYLSPDIKSEIVEYMKSYQ